MKNTKLRGENLFNCEHCGSSVKIRPVCPMCGREHSDQWISENVKTSKWVDKWVDITLTIILAILVLAHI
jgi:hypothetical protein